jgi:hypothetical protein
LDLDPAGECVGRKDALPIGSSGARHRSCRASPCIAPAVGTALDEQLRNFAIVEIFRNLELRGRANRPESKGDMLHFDKLARLVPGSPRHEAVVDADQVDLAAIDAALIVDHLHVGLLGQTERREPGARTGIRHRLADLDLGIGHPRRVLRGRRHRHRAAEQQAAEQDPKHCAPAFGVQRRQHDIIVPV